MNFWRNGFFILPILLCLCSGQLYAHDGLLDENEVNDGKIDIYYPVDVLLPYRDRRSNWSIETNINLENFIPNDFVSSNDGLRYNQLFDTDQIPMIQGSIGLKYNFIAGALSLDLVGGSGKVSSNFSGVQRTLEVLKKGATIGWTLDAIMREPYIAPYAQLQIIQIAYEDLGASAGDTRGQTDTTFGYSIGLLVQLNSIDPTETARIANSNFGLDNTYLDIFATQYNSSESTEDPEFKTALNWGAGLRLEF